MSDKSRYSYCEGALFSVVIELFVGVCKAPQSLTERNALDQATYAAWRETFRSPPLGCIPFHWSWMFLQTYILSAPPVSPLHTRAGVRLWPCIGTRLTVTSVCVLTSICMWMNPSWTLVWIIMDELGFQMAEQSGHSIMQLVQSGNGGMLRLHFCSAILSWPLRGCVVGLYCWRMEHGDAVV
eukprot:6486855-Amphidinium_carterae.2